MTLKRKGGIMLRYFRGILLLALVITFTGVFAQDQQTIYLKDGTSVKGKIVNQDSNNLLVETSYGTLEIPKVNVLRIDYGRELIKTQEIAQPEPIKIEGQTTKSAVSSGSVMVSGLISFTNSSGNLYTYDGQSLTSFTLVPNLVLFAAKSFGIGFDLSLTTLSQGGSSATSIAIGPKILFMGGEPNASSYFFAGMGMNYMSISQSGYYGSEINGTRIKFSLGIVPMVRQHLGFPIEAGILIDNLGQASYRESGIVLVIGTGLAGFIF
jgi:hypothetical protein